MNNLEKLKHAFSEALSIPIDQVTEELKYQGISEWDSVSHMFLVEAIETTFSLTIAIEDVLEMSSFANVKQVLTKLHIPFN